MQLALNKCLPPPRALCLWLLIHFFSERVWTWILGKANISLTLFCVSYPFSDVYFLIRLRAGFDDVGGAETFQTELCP